MICIPGERGTSRHGSQQNGIVVGVQPYGLTFSNREYSSSSAPTGNLLVTSRNTCNNNNSSPIFDLEMKRSYGEDSQKASGNMSASKMSQNSAAELPQSTTSPKQCKLSAQSSVASVDLKSSKSSTNNNGTTHRECEVFLGGSCNPTSWRTDIAIPMLNKAGITYFNPQVEDWYPELIEKEHHAKHNASLLFFVIDNQTRGVAAMAEVAYLVASGKKVILVITGFKGPGQLIMDEPISQSEYEELTCGQLLLQDLVERHGIPVFNDINTALLCTAKVIRDRVRPQDLLRVAADLVQPAFDTNTNIKIWVCSNLKKTFESLDASQNGEINLSDVANILKLLTNGKLGPQEVFNSYNKLRNGERHIVDVDSLLNSESLPNGDIKEPQNHNGKTLNYEEFCRLIAETILQHRNKSRTRLPASGVIKTSYISDRIPKNEGPTHDVYLAGPCSASENDNWRTGVAIPLLKKHTLSYLDCEASSLNRKLMTPLDTTKCDNSHVVFFYLPKSSRAVEYMIQIAYYVGLKREIVVCVENLKDDCKIDVDSLSKTAVKDYNRGRSYVDDMAKRDGFPVFHNLSDALNCVVDKCSGRNIST